MGEKMGLVRVEVLAREDCPNRGMALVVVERVAEEAGVPVKLAVVDVKSKSQAKRRRFLGSPSVRVEGLDVEPGANARDDFTLMNRLYRCGGYGFQGWPDENWVRSALLLASTGPSPNGNGNGNGIGNGNGNGNGYSERSSATSP